jgi:hypothetical protein
MNKQSPQGATLLKSLVDEIEATPEEHWEALLTTLRQFRQSATHQQSRIINPEQAKKNQAAIDLLQSWMNEEDEGEDAQAWEILKVNLDADRHSKNASCI